MIKLPIADFPRDPAPELTVNGGQRFEHDEIFTVDKQDVDVEEIEDACPNGPINCDVVPVHISETAALGDFSLDPDFYHWGRKDYVYILES